ncbi:DUF2284 domain-containing protein [Chloroflexota bacterium]
MVHKILAEVPEEQLLKDLEKYRQLALDMGAKNAAIVTTDKVIIDERVRAKCVYPKCDWYGTSAHCPPHGMDLDEVRKLVGKFRYAIFFRIEVPSEVTVWKGRTKEQKKTSTKYNKKRYDILAKIESAAFYDGYYLAVGFGGGPCKPFLCPTDETCQALETGKGCKHPFYARSSMEGAGMDVYRMVAQMGWDIYPFGMALTKDDVPFAVKTGIIFIA